MRTIDADALKAKYQAILDRGDMFCEYDIIGMLDNAPTVVNENLITERPQGEWVEDDYAGIHCSECSYIPLKDVVIKIYADGSKERGGNYNLTPYCPICGAYMRMKGNRE